MATNFPALEGKRNRHYLGGTAGLGLSAAKAFIASVEMATIAVGLKEAEAAAATAELGPSAQVMRADATQPETAATAIYQCISAFGGFDGLYHVAGGVGPRWGDGPLHEISDAGWGSDPATESYFCFLFEPRGRASVLSSRNGRHDPESQ